MFYSLALASCDQPAPGTCVATCTTPDPGADECAVELTLSDDCLLHVELAEVAIALDSPDGAPRSGNGCLEPVRLHPGEALVSCTRIPVGGTFKWTVRSTEWQWGPWEDTCPKGGLALPYSLSCQ